VTRRREISRRSSELRCQRLELDQDWKQENHQSASNLLAISGGAEDGAFGAGLLVGWSDGPATRPSFDLVTGGSSGALIAPFAFLGREHDNQLRELLPNTGEKTSSTYNVKGIRGGSALADDKPLSRLIDKYVDDTLLEEIARERMKGSTSCLSVPTNLDAQRPVMGDMGRIAMTPGGDATELFRRILAGIGDASWSISASPNPSARRAAGL